MNIVIFMFKIIPIVYVDHYTIFFLLSLNIQIIRNTENKAQRKLIVDTSQIRNYKIAWIMILSISLIWLFTMIFTNSHVKPLHTHKID